MWLLFATTERAAIASKARNRDCVQSAMEFRLRKQEFIELVRSGHKARAMEYAR